MMTLQKVDGESLFESQPKCKDFIIEALKFHLASGDANKLASFGNSARTKPRQPIGLPKVVNRTWIVPSRILCITIFTHTFVLLIDCDFYYLVLPR